jgi:formylglycine-generating enzyme required for sulfatase activity
VRYPAPIERLTLPNQRAIEFVFIPPGSFAMGREPRPDDPANILKPYPVHGVTFAKGFYMGRYPVTWGQWLALRPEDLQWGSFKNREPEAPIFYVSYVDIKRDFLPTLAKTLPTMKFRLPSEAEWEYALRAGSTTPYFWGYDYTRLSEFAWTWDGVGDAPSMPKVGGKQPNGWGLHDMFTALTCLEDWEQRPDYQGAPTDGSPWIINPDDPMPNIRMRGASFLVRAYETYNGSVRPNETFESACRVGSFGPTDSAPWMGFRLVLEAKD